MESCAAIFGLTGSAMIDLEDELSENFKLLCVGGQNNQLIRTEDRMEEIVGNKHFLCEEKRGRETKVSEITATAYPAKVRVLNSFKPPKDFDVSKKYVQGNTPHGRTGHTMGKLDHETIVMVGGTCVPKAGPIKYQADDSSLWLFKYETFKWIKCVDCEIIIRSGHKMHIHNKI